MHRLKGIFTSIARILASRLFSAYDVWFAARQRLELHSEIKIKVIAQAEGGTVLKHLALSITAFQRNFHQWHPLRQVEQIQLFPEGTCTVRE
jgi:hypothetical protein